MKSIIEIAREQAQKEEELKALEQSYAPKVEMSSKGGNISKYELPSENEKVLVMNNTTGILMMHNKTTKETRRFDEYGEKNYFTVGFLMGVKKLLIDGSLIILEENESKPVSNYLIPNKQVISSVLDDEQVSEVLNTMRGSEFRILLNNMHPDLAIKLCHVVVSLHEKNELFALDTFGIRDEVSRYLDKPSLFVNDEGY